MNNYAENNLTGLRKRWQNVTFDHRQQTSDGIFVIRVPEPELINTHSHLEMLHETNIKSVQREPSQIEKGKVQEKKKH